MQKIYLNAFDTQLEFLLCAEECKCDVLHEILQAECARYENLFSRTIPTSDIGLLNSSGGQWVEVSRDTYDLIEIALEYCSKTGGLYDITVAPLVELWNFKEKRVPNSGEIQEAMQKVAWDKIELKQEGTRCYARLHEPVQSIDLGGIAKGYIADALGCTLKENGVQNFLVNLGGNILCSGNREDGEPWVVGIKSPSSCLGGSAVERNLKKLRVHNASVVTSGIYERCFVKEGKFYHHIIDPRTGYPAQTDVASVTVCAKKSIDAEGFSTALLIMGSVDGAEFAYEQPEIMAAYFYDKNDNLLACVFN